MNGGPICWLWFGEFKTEGKLAKKLAKKVAKAVK